MAGKNSDLKVSIVEKHEGMTRAENIMFLPGGSGSRVDSVRSFPRKSYLKYRVHLCNANMV